MINLKKNTEAILQKVERFDRLVLEPYYRNRIIPPTMNYSISQQQYPPVAADLIPIKIWHSNAKLETYDRNNIAFKC